MKRETKYCAFDKDRICDEKCVAFVPECEGIDSEAYFDISSATPKFI